MDDDFETFYALLKSLKASVRLKKLDLGFPKSVFATLARALDCRFTDFSEKTNLSIQTLTVDVDLPGAPMRSAARFRYSGLAHDNINYPELFSMSSVELRRRFGWAHEPTCKVKDEDFSRFLLGAFAYKISMRGSFRDVDRSHLLTLWVDRILMQEREATHRFINRCLEKVMEDSD